MALFSTMPTGSGGISPLFPNLILRFSTDGLGLVFEDPSLDFLLVWNADYIDRAIEYSPGLFTPVLVSHTATTAVTGEAGGLIRPGPTTFDFNRARFAFDFEIDLYPTANSEYPFPGNYDNSSFRDDTAYSSHRTGAGRRSATWPPLRGMRYHPDPVAQGKAWASTISWCKDQFHRPLAHIAGAFAPPVMTPCTNDWRWNVGDTNREWGYNNERVSLNLKETNNPNTPQDDRVHGWNAFDGAHNESHVQFALAVAGHPLGACLLWLLFTWHVQGSRPGNRCSTSSYFTGMFDQDRSLYHSLMLYVYSYLIGFQWADPNLIRDWCGGMIGLNGGLGWTPSKALTLHFKTFAGPVYFGGGSDAHFVQLRLNPPPGYEEEYRPHRGCKVADFNNWTFNGINYRRVFGHDRAFQRYMGCWGVPEVIRAHDYVQSLDPTEFLLEEADAPGLKDAARHHVQYVLDTGLVRQGSSSHGFAVRTMMFDHPGSLSAALAMPVGFESQAALEAALADALQCEPNWVNEDNDSDGQNEPDHPWVYPGTDGSKPWHLFAYEFPTFERGVGKWLLIPGARISGENGPINDPDTECRSTGPAAYAFSFGYDSNLQAIIDRYSSHISDPSNGDPKDYEIVWRAKEKSEQQGQDEDRAPTAAAAIGVSVVGSFRLGDHGKKPANRFVIAASSLGSYAIFGPLSRTPPPATALALGLSPPYTIGTPPPLGQPVPPAFAIPAASLGGIDLSTIPSHQLEPAFAIARASLGELPEVTRDEIRVPAKNFVTTQALLGSWNLSDRPTPPLIAFAVAASVGPATADGDAFGYRPEAATAVAASVDPTYTVTGPGGTTRRTPQPAFVIAASLPNTPTIDSLGITPTVDSVVAVATLGSYALSLPIANHYDQLIAFALAVSVFDRPEPGPAIKNPAASTARAVAIDPLWILSGTGEDQSPPASFALAASSHAGYQVAETKIPRNVQEVGVEIADRVSIEGGV